MRAENELAFPVLSDVGSRALDSYGLVFELPEYLQSVCKECGVDLPEVNGDGKFRLPVPATYVIAKDGRIVWAHIDLDYTKRAEPSDILGALDRLR